MKKHIIQLIFETKEGETVATVTASMDDKEFKCYDDIVFAAIALAARVRKTNPDLQLTRLKNHRYLGVVDEKEKGRICRIYMN